MEFEDTHRNLLQTIMHAGIMSDYDMRQKVAATFNHQNSVAFYVTMMNTKLEPLEMMIKSACCEFTGEKYWMLMCTTIDNFASFQTEFSQGQLELLRHVFQEIIASADGCASSLDCLNLTLENYLSKAAREEFLNDAIQRMWLTSKDGCYYMGVRSIIELMPYFRSTYQDFNICPLCRQAVFHGQRCEECQVVAHLYCLANHARVQKPLKCSNCNKIIPADDLPESQEPITNGEENSEEPDSDLRHKRTKTRTHRSRNNH